MPTRRLRTGRARKSSPPKLTSPASGVSSPASTRSRVVLPEPEGPSSARNSLSSACSETFFRAGKRPNTLETPRISSASGAASVFAACGKFTGVSPLQSGLEEEGDEPEGSQERRGREGPDEIIV